MTTFKSESEILPYVTAKLDAVTAAIAACGISREDADAKAEESHGVLIESMKGDADATAIIEANAAAVSQSLRYSEIEYLAETFKAAARGELMLCNARYVMVAKGDKLVSPAGFSPSDRVFARTSTAVCIDKLPRSSNLSYYDLAELSA